MPHTYRLASDVVFKEVSDGGVLLSRSSGQYRQVNTTGTRVLQRLVAGEPWTAILDHMIERYPGIDEGRLSQDLSQMLEGLADEGVLVRV
ncbi:Coenzyme PQQ synthesis protein D (PqqD) [Plantibacter sp. VKM Ac-1784]|uniref:Coenzyme PQQ synthesis protein D (PqqD) n=1 Tax=Plantibacter elymi (nom. nud.) TaxID=199708 RepID=A0ABY1RIZ4_9MICO|nr:PqqD family peptide modification chaperone [Plantibacter sp. VKM Ac-1784]SMQ75544.1 Coenzyme PQQ synthesis protein D (PqqD) [Plantibacter sp. VKM Ac-1784]